MRVSLGIRNGQGVCGSSVGREVERWGVVGGCTVRSR